MASLRRLFHRPAVLADGPSPRTCVAGERTLAIPCAGPGLDRDVGRHRRIDWTVAGSGAVFDVVELASCPAPVRLRSLYLLARWRALQLVPARRPARSSRKEPRPAPGDDGNSVTRPPSDLSRAPV